MNEKMINKMLPPELIKVKKLIDALLETKPNERLTNLEYLEKQKNIKYPIDENNNIKKNDKKNRTKR